MHVDPTKPPAHEPPALDKGEHFFVVRNRRRRQRAQELEHFLALREVAAGKLPNYERVSDDQSVVEQRREPHLMAPEVIDPDRRIDEQGSASRPRPPARNRFHGPIGAA